MKTLILAVFCLTTGFSTQAQKETVNGNLKNKGTSEPVSFATISALNSKTSTTSDDDGYFQIFIRKFPDTLVVTYLADTLKKVAVFTPETALNLEINIKSTQLQDVIINTGYEKSSPNQVNGSYTAVNAQTLNKQAGMNILDRLNGVVDGLLFNKGKSNPNPQNQTNITIRGLSTINGPLDPLIVLDNFIYEGDLNNINPGDIESVTVLKDASATSIWGARAGNGVIVLTSKKGSFNQKTRLSFNSNVTFQAKPNLYYLPRISSADYINLEQFLFNEGYYDDQINKDSRPPLSPAVEIMIAAKNGQITSADSAAEISSLEKIDSRNEFSKYLLRNGITEQYNLSLQGGNSTLGWILSGGYDHSTTNLREVFERINLRLDNRYRPFKKLELNTAFTYSNTSETSGVSDYQATSSIGNRRFVPYLQLADEKGNALPVTHNYQAAYVDTAGDGNLFDWHFYPLDDWKHSVRRSKISELIASVAIQYKIAHGLSIQLRYQYQKQDNVRRINNDTSSFYTRDLINLFTQIDRQDGTLKYIVPVGAIVHESQADQFSENFRSQIDYQRHWDNSRLIAVGGLETRETGNSGRANTLYGYFADPLTVENVDVINYYPTYVTGNTSQLSGANSFSNTNYRFASFYANGGYTFKERYSVNVSGRKDGSNVFGAKTNDKWKPLWSAGFGWVISSEQFFEVPWLRYLKLSYTRGSSGNIDVSKTPLPVAGAAVDYVTGLPFIRINLLNNPDLRWEQVTQSNFKILFAFPKNRILGSIEYYRKIAQDLYGMAPYDYTAWGRNPTITKNIAKMKGTGIDVNVQSRNLIGEFNWNTQLLVAYNDSRTTDYYSAIEHPVSQAIGGGTIINPIVGRPLYSIFAYRWGGLDNKGNPQGFIGKERSTDYNAISENIFNHGLAGNSVVYKGSASPKIFGNVINSFSWRALEIDFNFSYSFGYYLFRPALSYSTLVDQGIGLGEYSRRWQKQGDETSTNVPSFVFPTDNRRDQFYQYSEVNVIKGDNIRLRYINLSYTFFKKEILPFKSLQVYGNIADVGILWRANRENIDPDYISSISRPSPKITIGFRTGF